MPRQSGDESSVVLGICSDSCGGGGEGANVYHVILLDVQFPSEAAAAGDCRLSGGGGNNPEGREFGTIFEYYMSFIFSP